MNSGYRYSQKPGPKDVPVFPSTYGGLRDFHFGHIHCRATSSKTSPLSQNFSSRPITWSFLDPALIGHILQRFDTFLDQIGPDTLIPPAATAIWEGVVDHLYGESYLDESWVVDLSTILFLLVSALLRPHLSTDETRRFVTVSAPQLGETTQGDRTPHVVSCEHDGQNPERLSGVPHEYKQEPAMHFALSSFVYCTNSYATLKLHGGSAIFAELDNHRDSFVTDADSEGVECRYGAVFSGSELVLVEWCQVDEAWVTDAVPAQTGQVRVLRNTALVRVAGPEASVSYLAVLIGMLLPSSIVAYPDPDLTSKPWQVFRRTMQRAAGGTGGRIGDGDGYGEGRGGTGGGDGPGDGGSGTGGGDGPGDGGDASGTGRANEGRGGDGKGRKDEGKLKRKRGDTESRQDGGNRPGIQKEIHKTLSPSFPVSSVIIEFAGAADETQGFVVPAEHALALVNSYRHNPNLADGWLWEEQAALTIQLVESLPSQHTHAVWRAVHMVAGAKVILKRFEEDHFQELETELAACARLDKLPSIASCRGVIVSRRLRWLAAILDDAGPTLKASGGWDDLPGDDKITLYSTFREMHTVGVMHGDVAARNIVRKRDGGVCVIDFGEADLDHRCPGSGCPEMARLRNLLEGGSESDES